MKLQTVPEILQYIKGALDGFEQCPPIGEFDDGYKQALLSLKYEIIQGGPNGDVRSTEPRGDRSRMVSRG